MRICGARSLQTNDSLKIRELLSLVSWLQADVLWSIITYMPLSEIIPMYTFVINGKPYILNEVMSICKYNATMWHFRNCAEKWKLFLVFIYRTVICNTRHIITPTITVVPISNQYSKINRNGKHIYNCSSTVKTLDF